MKDFPVKMEIPILPEIPPLKLGQAIRVKFSPLSVDPLEHLRMTGFAMWDAGASLAGEN